ncbi:M16 family metallopeptidase [Steroidobacter sp.]|uniref:M16 family metallopeptidase n=1 Tax=Steroidobacter sp. TaxID=1978227 RepID=UPI001A60F3A2|nr:pitrilysin family protein [Steroidobacter sp.]MBL8268956.1 insulinase family protein [Steroidobacter sp.]
MLARTGLLLGLLLGLLIAYAPSRAFANQIPYERFVLPNGLTLIVHEDRKADIVALSVWYRAGSREERADRGGFAHLFEHLMFVGSDNHNEEFFRPMREAGAVDMSGWTKRDYTIYYQTVPTGALDRTLWLESDRMGRLLGVTDQKKLDAQRGVVQNEKREYEGMPYGKIDSIIAAHSYPSEHPYSRNEFGSMAALGAASLDDVHQWFKDYNGAANAVIVVAGAVNPADVHAKVQEYFGDLPPGPALGRRKAWVAKQSGEQRLSVVDQVPQARLYKVWNVPGYATRDHALLEVVASILGEPKIGRLHQRLVQTEQLATSVEAKVTVFELGAQVQVMAAARDGVELRKIEAALDEEMSRLLRDGPSDLEVQRAVTMSYARYVQSIQKINGVARNGKMMLLGLGELYAESPSFHDTRLQWVRGATAQALRSVAQQWLADGALVLEAEARPAYTTTVSHVDRSKLPGPGAPSAPRLSPLQRATLSNGLKIALAERHDVPAVDIRLIMNIGHAADAQATSGTASATLEMLMEGTLKQDALKIAQRAAELGAQINVSSSLDASVLSLSALSPQLNGSLQLFGDILLHPAFSESALNQLRASRVAAIAREKADSRGLAMRLLPQQIYGNGHPYATGSTGSGTEASIQALQRADVQAFYRRWVRPDNATLLVVGDTTIQQITAALERQLGAWRAPSEPLPVKTVAAVTGSRDARVFLIDRPGAMQSLIMAGSPASARGGPDYQAFEVVNAVLGGTFISRLNLNLREDKHWAYVVRSLLTGAQGGGALMVEAPVQTDKTAPAIAEILKEVRALQGPRPPTAGEIQFAQDGLTLSLAGKNETLNDWANTYTEVLVNGLSDDYWQNYATQLGELSTQKLTAAAARLLQPDALTWLIQGDLANIEAEVRALQLGVVKVIDANGTVVR